MGNNQSSQSRIRIPNNCKIYSEIPLDSPMDQEQIEHLLKKRFNLLVHCPYICTISGHQIVADDDKDADLACKENQRLFIFYQPFDFQLSQLPVATFFQEHEIIHLILCVCHGLKFLYQHGVSYGDVCPENICRRGNNWMLVDQAFLKNGITAYEKVLEGELGFISPLQMEKIRHGLVRESPEIKESDDIFALGLIALQMASSKPSSHCYSDSGLRFNMKTMAEHFLSTRYKVSQKMLRLIESMIDFEEETRITLNQLMHQCMTWNQNLAHSPQNSNTIPRNIPPHYPPPQHHLALHPNFLQPRTSQHNSLTQSFINPHDNNRRS